MVKKGGDELKFTQIYTKIASSNKSDSCDKVVEVAVSKITLTRTCVIRAVSLLCFFCSLGRRFVHKSRWTPILKTPSLQNSSYYLDSLNHPKMFDELHGNNFLRHPESRVVPT